jgi:protein kinase C substrate 80K-H
MILPLQVLLPLLPLIASIDAFIIGVAPKDRYLYAPTDRKWACISNPEIVLDWSQVNDDYCDCPDGSDEPGTSACKDNLFWCENEGHIGSYIPSHLVNDGVCDYDNCCDGSDEWNTGVQCENKCKEIHEKYEQDRIVMEKVLKIGKDKASKIIRAAQKLRSKLQESLSTEETLLSFYTSEVRRFQKDFDDREESQNKDLFSELKVKLDESKDIISMIFDSFIASKDDFQKVNGILDQLLANFNENLNDNAVKKTVEVYRTFLGQFKEHTVDFPKLQKALKGKFNKGVKGFSEVSTNVIDELNEAWSVSSVINTDLNMLEDILNYFIENYNPNFNDPHVKEAVNAYQDYLSNKEFKQLDQSILYSVSETFKQVSEKLSSLVQKQEQSIEAQLKASGESLYERLRSRLHFVIQDFLGTGPKEPFSPLPQDEPQLNQAILDFEEQIKSVKSSIESIDSQLSKNYGPHDIFRAMGGITKSAKLGEYDYELDIIGDVRQKGANGHNVKIGTYDHAQYDNDGKMVVYYENGAKCWNGPHRRAVVKVECSDDHLLLGVSEPEKCEYHFRMKSPLGCHIEDSVQC